MTTATSEELCQQDDELHVRKRLHKHSAPEHRAQPRTVLARTGRVAQRKHAQQQRGECGAQGVIAQGASAQGMAAQGVGTPGESAGAGGGVERAHLT